MKSLTNFIFESSNQTGKKYRLTDETIKIDGRTLYRIEALKKFGRVMLFRSHEAAEDQERQERQREAPQVPQEAEEGYSGMLRSIRRSNDRIADPELSRKMDRLEEIAGKILKLVEEDPAKKNQAATFLNYYLPTTEKLLDSYADFEEAGVSGENLTQAKEKIRRTMDSIMAGFERQLDALYHADAMDVDSDIRVMEQMLRRDIGKLVRCCLDKRLKGG